MKIAFYNHFNNGDIHVSREFVKDIIRKTQQENCFYYHKNSERILLDIPEIKVVNPNLDFLNNYNQIVRNSDIIYINTWYNSNQVNHTKYGCTLKNLYENFKIVYNELGISIEPEEFYIPKIDFNSYYTDRISSFFSHFESNKKIFISNCVPLSGQSPKNINWDELILGLSANFPDHLFFITNGTSVERKTCISTKMLINNLVGNDLCENAFISTFCDVIIGNNSGPHTFTYINENILGEKKQMNIMISYYQEFTSLFNKKSKSVFSLKTTDDLLPNIHNLIEKHI